MDKVKLGIIGGGNMAQWAHLPCFGVLRDAELAALYDPRKETGKKVCAKWNIPKYTDSLDELLDMDIGAVCVLTPVQCHKSQIIAALEAGKHVFTEKPLAMSVKSAEEIKAVVEKSGKLVMVGYMKQHEANIGSALEFAGKNDFGKILFVRTHSFIGSYWHACVDKLTETLTSDEPLPQVDASALDYGPESINAERDSVFYSFDNPFYGLLDTGCHSINLLRFLTKKDYELVSVYSKSGARIMNFDFGDFMGTSEFCINFNMHKWDEVTELYYEKGTIKIKTPQPTFMQAGAEVEVYSEDGIAHKNMILENNHEWAFLRQAQKFVENVSQNNVTMKYVDESIKDIEMIEKIYSKEQGEQ
jgi:predicted dehydrogenase